MDLKEAKQVLNENGYILERVNKLTRFYFTYIMYEN